MAEQNAGHSEAYMEATESSLGQYRPEVPTRGRLRGYSAGDIHGAFIREARLALERAGGNALQATNTGLSRLQGEGLITAREVNHLSRILEVMFAQAHGEDSRREYEAFGEVRDIYQTMVLEADASATGLAIGSVAVDAFLTALLDGLRGDDGQEGQTAAASTGRRLVTMAADGAGAVIGGVAGGAIGGSEGAQAGAAVGGIGASAIVGAIQEAVK